MLDWYLFEVWMSGCVAVPVYHPRENLWLLVMVYDLSNVVNELSFQSRVGAKY